MGKVQCVSLKSKTEFWEIIEKSINNIDTPLDKKIYDEYYKLKSELKSKNKNKKEDEVSQKQNFISYKKQMDRFIKWYYMSHPNQKTKKINCEKISTKSKFEDLQLKKIHIEYISPDKDNVPISTPNRVYGLSNKEKPCANNSVIRKVKFSFETEAREKINQEKNRGRNKNSDEDGIISGFSNNNGSGNGKDNNEEYNNAHNKNDLNCNGDMRKSFTLNNYKDASENLNVNNNKNNCIMNKNKNKNGDLSNKDNDSPYLNSDLSNNKGKQNLNFDSKVISLDNSAIAQNNLDANRTRNNSGTPSNNNNNNNRNLFNMNSRMNSNVASLNVPKPMRLQEPIKIISNKSSGESDATRQPNPSLIDGKNKFIEIYPNPNNPIKCSVSEKYKNTNSLYNKNQNLYLSESDIQNEADLSSRRNKLGSKPTQGFSHSQTARESALISRGGTPPLPLSSSKANTRSPSKMQYSSHISYVYSERNQSSIEYENNSELNFFSKANIIELDLRKFYALKNKKFLDRVFKGPPASFRWQAWAISANLPLVRDADQYQFLVTHPIAEKTDVQIKKDLHRTLSDFSKFNFPSAQHSLYKILKALSINDMEVGYCQGMNFIAGFLLIMSDFNELDTFYLMISLMSRTFTDHLGIRGFFSEGFPLLKLYVQAFHVLFEKKMPDLKKHFESLEIPDEVWISKWFQTLFTLSLPIEFCRRIWDCILSQGLEFLLSFALAFVKYLETDLLSLLDLFEVIEFFKKLTPFYLVENEGNLKAIETSLGLLRKLNVEEVIFNARKISLPKNFVKTQMEIFEIKCASNLNNFNFNNFNDEHKENNLRNFKKFKFEDLEVKYEHFLNAYEIGGVCVDAFTPTGSNAFSPELPVKSKTNPIDFDESDVIDINENCNQLNNITNHNVKENKFKGSPNILNIEEEINYKVIISNNEYGYYNNDKTNVNKLGDNNKHNYNSEKKGHSNVNTASDDADMKTHNSTDPHNIVIKTKNNLNKDKSRINIKFPTETSTTIVNRSESQISSSNNLNSENIYCINNHNNINNLSTFKNNNFKASGISSSINNSITQNGNTTTNKNDTKNKILISSDKNLKEKDFQQTYSSNGNKSDKEMIISSIMTIENTPTFHFDKNMITQNQKISNFQLIENSKRNSSKSIQRLSNKTISNMPENNNKINNKNHFVKIPNEKINKKIIENKNNLEGNLNLSNFNNQKIINANKRILDKLERDSESKFANIPNDVNDWEISGKFEDSLNDPTHSIEQENTSDPENNLNISKKIHTYTFNTNSNKNLKQNFFLNDLNK